MNRVTVRGRLRTNAFVQTAQSGKSYCTLLVDTQRTYKGAPEITPAQVKVFGRQSDNAANLLQGQEVLIEGHVQSREWNGKWYTDVVSDSITPIGDAPKATDATPSDDQIPF